jgi:hypothetical protein
MSTLIQALRCIGQNLEQFPIVKDVDIEPSEGSYFVRVTVKWPFKGKTPEAGENGFRATSSPKDGKSAGPIDDAAGTDVTRSFQLRYTDKDIQYLEREGVARRRDPRGTPDFLSLSQILRTAGAQIENKSGQLIKISRHFESEGVQWLIIKFRSYNGEEREERHAGPHIYDLCVRWYKQRNGGAFKVVNL